MVKIPKEDFLDDAKFASCSGKDWLLLILIGCLINITERYLPEYILFFKFSSINSWRVRHSCFIHYKITV